jgi:hypothetical protein
MVTDVAFKSRLDTLGVNMDDPTEVLGIEIPKARPAKWLFNIPGVIIVALVLLAQIKRRRKIPQGKPVSKSLNPTLTADIS